MKLTRSLAFLFLLMAHPAMAAISLGTDQTPQVPAEVEGPIKEALAAFNDGRHLKALDLARPLAEKGNPDALFLLGYAYESGRGVEASREKTLEYYRRASEAGQKDAIYRLSLILLNSKEQSEREEGKKTLENAAQKDPAGAGRLLGETYLKGLITGKPDFDEAAKWWTSASEAGDVPSILALARLYDGIKEFEDKKDVKKALTLFRKAITLGDKTAIVAVGSRLLNGDESIRNEKEGRDLLNKAIENKQFEAYLALGDFEESVKKNFKAALEHYEQGGSNQQVDCALRASDIYFEGKDGVKKDEAKGLEWLRKAAETKNPTAGYRYAAKLLKAPDTDKRTDDEKVSAARTAYNALLNAANGGIVQAQNEIALFYLSGAMGVADPSAAAGWFQRAAQNGSLVAMNNLGTLYERGYGVAQNFSQAGQIYEAAARLGSAPAAAAVARLMASGNGTTRNIPQAWAWANIAIQNGNDDAKAILGEISTLASTSDIEEGKKKLEELRKELSKSADAAANASGSTSAAPSKDAAKEPAKESAPTAAETSTSPPISVPTEAAPKPAKP